MGCVAAASRRLGVCQTAQTRCTRNAGVRQRLSLFPRIAPAAAFRRTPRTAGVDPDEPVIGRLYRL